MFSINNIREAYHNKLSDSNKMVATMCTGILLSPISTYIHEYGHAIAMRILFKNTNPNVVVHPFGGGHCTYGFPDRADFYNLWGLIPAKESPILSNIGNQVGYTTSFSLVSAAGPIVESVILALTILKFPKLAGPLLLHPTIDIALYAISVFKTIADYIYLQSCELPGHDYCSLWEKSGPWAYAIVAAVSFTPLVLAIYFTVKRILDPLSL